MSLHVWKSLATDPEENPFWECINCGAQSHKEEPRDDECEMGDDRPECEVCQGHEVVEGEECTGERTVMVECPACEGSGRWQGCLSAAPDDNCPDCGGSGEKP